MPTIINTYPFESLAFSFSGGAAGGLGRVGASDRRAVRTGEPPAEATAGRSTLADISRPGGGDGAAGQGVKGWGDNSMAVEVTLFDYHELCIR